MPPRPRCLTCGIASDEWVPVGPEGTVRTWTVARGSVPPVVFALIQLDGADTAMLHRLLGVRAGDERMDATADAWAQAVGDGPASAAAGAPEGERADADLPPVRIGMRVVAIVAPVRHGDVRDLAGFRPV